MHEKLSQYYARSLHGCVKVIMQVFCLRLRAASDQEKHAVHAVLLEIHFHMKIIPTMISTNLVRSSLLSLLSFRRNQNQESNFQ